MINNKDIYMKLNEEVKIKSIYLNELLMEIKNNFDNYDNTIPDLDNCHERILIFNPCYYNIDYFQSDLENYFKDDKELYIDKLRKRLFSLEEGVLKDSLIKFLYYIEPVLEFSNEYNLANKAFTVNFQIKFNEKYSAYLDEEIKNAEYFIKNNRNNRKI